MLACGCVCALQDTELGPSYTSAYEGYTAMDDDVLDPWADARKQLGQGDAEVRDSASQISAFI